MIPIPPATLKQIRAIERKIPAESVMRNPLQDGHEDVIVNRALGIAIRSTHYRPHWWRRRKDHAEFYQDGRSRIYRSMLELLADNPAVLAKAIELYGTPAARIIEVTPQEEQS